jgi:YHS domain-containing protein
VRKENSMKRLVMCAALAAIWVGSLSGCSQKEEETTVATPPTATAPATTTVVTTAHPLGSVKVGDKAVCVICAAKEGTSVAEDVKETLDYQGKTYAFCNLDEKAEFISDPSKYAGPAK